MQHNMNFHIFLAILAISGIGVFTTNFTCAIDHVNSAEFLQNGLL